MRAGAGMRIPAQQKGLSRAPSPTWSRAAATCWPAVKGNDGRRDVARAARGIDGPQAG